jgi:hypothetical protein
MDVSVALRCLSEPVSKKRHRREKFRHGPVFIRAVAGPLRCRDSARAIPAICITTLPLFDAEPFRKRSHFRSRIDATPATLIAASIDAEKTPSVFRSRAGLSAPA